MDGVRLTVRRPRRNMGCIIATLLRSYVEDSLLLQGRHALERSVVMRTPLRTKLPLRLAVAVAGFALIAPGYIPGQEVQWRNEPKSKEPAELFWGDAPGFLDYA